MNKLARSITKWTKACDKRLNRLTSYIHHTCEYKQYCHVGNTAQHCRLGLFQDSDFAGDLEDSKSISGGTFCIFGSHTFVPINWMCKKQTAVSHSSTESEIISLDARLRLDRIPAFALWDLIVAVLWNTSQHHTEQGDLLKNKLEVCSPPHTIHKRKQYQRVINDLHNVDFIPSNVQSSHQEALLYVFEDNEAVIKMIIKGSEKGLFLSVYVDDIKIAGKNKILIRCGNYSIKKLIWENQHLSWITYTWGALKDNVKHAKMLLTITEPRSNPEFPHAKKVYGTLF